MPAWLRAGLIGAIILIVLGLIGLIPFWLTACLVLPLYFVAYIGIGALAARYMPPPRSAGQGAGQGALAGGLAAVIGGLFNLIAQTVQTVFSSPATTLNRIPPWMWDWMSEMGMDPSLMIPSTPDPVGSLLGGTICCGFGIFFALALAAIGGAIYAAVKQV